MWTNMYLAEMALPVLIFLFHGEKHIIRMLPKISLSTRITKAISNLTQFTCYCILLPLTALFIQDFIMTNKGAKDLNKAWMFDL